MKAIVVLENNFLIIIWPKKGPHYYNNIAVMMELGLAVFMFGLVWSC